MDGFNSRDFYGHSLSEDPKLRTIARSCEFRYNFSDHLGMYESPFKMDRERQVQEELFKRNRLMPSLSKMRRTRKGQSRLFEPIAVDTEIGRSKAKETVVKVMTEAEIEAMISQALLSLASVG